MNDVFVEQIIEQRQSGKGILIKFGIIFSALLISSVFLFFGALRTFFPMVFAVCIYGAVVTIRMQNLEYEYSFTNGDLDVDRIIGRKKRARELSISVRSFEILAPMTEAFKNEYESQSIRKEIHAEGSPKSPSRWFAKFSDDAGIVTLLVFEPNERLIEAMRKYIPRKIMDGNKG